MPRDLVAQRRLGHSLSAPAVSVSPRRLSCCGMADSLRADTSDSAPALTLRPELSLCLPNRRSTARASRADTREVRTRHACIASSRQLGTFALRRAALRFSLLSLMPWVTHSERYRRCGPASHRKAACDSVEVYVARARPPKGHCVTPLPTLTPLPFFQLWPAATMTSTTTS